MNLKPQRTQRAAQALGAVRADLCVRLPTSSVGARCNVPLPVLNGDEFDILRRIFGSHAAAARFLGANERTYRSWRTAGLTRIPEHIRRYLATAADAAVRAQEAREESRSEPDEPCFSPEPDAARKEEIQCLRFYEKALRDLADRIHGQWVRKEREFMKELASRMH